MAETIVLDGFVDKDGCLTIQLPEDAPRGHVRIIIEKVVHEDDQVELSDADLQGQPDTNDDQLDSEAFGIWRNRTDFADGADYVDRMRHSNEDVRD